MTRLLLTLSLVLLTLNISLAEDLGEAVVKMRATAEAYSDGAKDFTADIDSTLALINGMTEMAKWADEVKTKFQPEIDKKTANGRQLEASYGALLREVSLFVKKRESFDKVYQRDFDQSIQRAEKISDQALKSKTKVAFEGARTELAKARKITEIVLAVHGKDKALPLAQKLKTTMNSVAEKDQELQRVISDSTQAPVDSYAGDDAESLRKLIQDEWKKTHPTDEIIKVVLHSNTWQRTIRFSWDSGNKEWGVGDTMVLPARVIVKTDPMNATIFMAYINRHPLSKSESVGTKTKTAEYVQEVIPLEKLN